MLVKSYETEMSGNRFCAVFAVKSFVFVSVNYLEVLYFIVIYYLISKKLQFCQYELCAFLCNKI